MLWECVRRTQHWCRRCPTFLRAHSLGFSLSGSRNTYTVRVLRTRAPRRRHTRNAPRAGTTTVPKFNQIGCARMGSSEQLVSLQRVQMKARTSNLTRWEQWTRTYNNHDCKNTKVPTDACINTPQRQRIQRIRVCHPPTIASKRRCLLVHGGDSKRAALTRRCRSCAAAPTPTPSPTYNNRSRGRH